MKQGSSALLIAVALLAVACADAAEPAPALETDEQKTLYALGLVISANLKDVQFTPEEWALVNMGMTDGVLGNEEKVDLEVYGPKIDALMQQKVTAATAKEKEAGAAFLAEQAGLDGAVKSDTGLVYFEITPGTGATPGAMDKVRVHYHGTLRDGEVFDSSVGQDPVEFPLAGVVPCFSEGIQKMKVGGKSKLVCPSDLAYGERGAPPRIPPGATLVFEVELLAIVEQEAPAAATPAP
jgi:FKBP-type peptidyl-prolyl cis-trans isomerase